MKSTFTYTAIALTLVLAAPSTFAMTSSDSFETCVVNHIQRIAPSIEIPLLTDKDLGFLKTVLKDSGDNN